MGRHHYDEPEYVEIDVETKAETELAVLFTDGDDDFWVPKSCMEKDSWPEIGESGTANIVEWFAEKEGLI